MFVNSFLRLLYVRFQLSIVYASMYTYIYIYVQREIVAIMMYVWRNECMMSDWMSQWTNEWMPAWMHERMHARMDGWMDGWNKHTDK
jgi:hypothetical protein